jgi:putative sterol carrier protein
MPQVTSVEQVFSHIDEGFRPDKAEGMDAIFQFALTGDNGGNYWVKVANQQVEAHEGVHDAPTMTLRASADDFLALVNGDLNPMAAFMQGKIKVQGDMGLALKLQTVLGLS